MVLPLLKLGTLALRTLSKPIAVRLKKEAGRLPRFRNFIISFAQANHRMTTTMQRRIHSHATDVRIRPMNEEKAVQAAVDLLGEFFIFSVAVAALVFEVQRSSRSEAKKEELRKQEMKGMRKRDEELAKEVELLKQKLEEIDQMARGRGLAGVFNIKYAHAEEVKPVTAA
ncbi:OPA3 [Olea europaea subsp. europaea]|uniref:OPA3 n=1 Tax=Olea europaea subsp. europaea TaxID=158383 RepID=A0A8S0TMN5_OLEEU|nr:OPA3 [Olea europaea subsp. europaea]